MSRISSNQTSKKAIYTTVGVVVASVASFFEVTHHSLAIDKYRKYITKQK